MHQNNIFYQKIKKNFSERHNLLCLGLDPDPEKIPLSFGSGFLGIENFLENVIKETADKVICYKPNISFFEALGLDGLKLLEKIIKFIPINVPIILDAKRGDIGNTSKMQAKFIFDYFNADAITLHPYMGYDSLAPFFEYKSKFCFVLALTSNPSAIDFEKQNLQNNTPFYQKVAEKVIEWNQTTNNIGLVVGGTQKELSHLREFNNDLLYLIPGIGAQGGNYHEIKKIGINNDNLALINVSRSILYHQKSNFSIAIESLL